MLTSLKNNSKGIACTLIPKLTFALLTLIINYLLARTLNVEDFGEIAVFFTIVTVASLCLVSGVSVFLTREGGKSIDSARDLRKKVALSLSVVIFSGCLLWIIVVVANQFVSLDSAYLYYFPLIVMSFGVARVCSSYMRLLNKHCVANFPELVAMPGVFVGLVFLGELFGFKMLNPYMLYTLSCVCVSLYTLVIAMKNLHIEGINSRYVTKAAGVLLTEFYKYRFSVLMLSVLAGARGFSNNIDILILSVAGSLEEVALYKVAITFSLLGSLVMNVLAVYLAPQVAICVGKGGAGMQDILRFSIVLSFASSFCFTLFLYLFSNVIVEAVFGLDYLSSVNLIKIVVLSQLVSSSFGIVAIVLNMFGHEAIVFRAILESICLAVLISIPAYFLYGVIGVALTNVLTVLWWNARMSIILFKKYGVRSDPFILLPSSFLKKSG